MGHLRWRTVRSLGGLRLAAAILLVPATAGVAAGADPSPREADWSPITEASLADGVRELTDAEVADLDVTGSRAATAWLASLPTSEDDRPDHMMVVSRLGDAHWLAVSAGTPIRVFEYEAPDGGLVREAAPVVAPSEWEPAASGFAVPPRSAWEYNNDGTGSETKDTWFRRWWWTITKADHCGPVRAAPPTTTTVST